MRRVAILLLEHPFDSRGSSIIRPSMRMLAADLRYLIGLEIFTAELGFLERGPRKISTSESLHGTELSSGTAVV